MYPVSNAYKEAIASNVVTSNWEGMITTTAGNQIMFNRNNLLQNQSKLTRQYASADTLEIGTAYSSQLTIVLSGSDYDRYVFYGATIVLNFKLKVASSIVPEPVPCGVFTVTDAEFQYNSVKLIAYDSMQKFSGKISGLEDAEPYDGLDAICEACGVTLGNDREEIEYMVNGTEELAFSQLEDTETYRDVIGYVAAILCANAVIGRDDKLYIKQYPDTSVRTIEDSHRYSSSYIDYIGRYNRIALTDADGNEETYTASGEYSGTCLTMNIGKNPLLNANENRETMAQDIVDKIVELVYAPCTISMPQDPSLDIGDMLELDGEKFENPVNIIITKQDIKLYGQTQIVSAGGDYQLTEARTKTEKTIEQVIPQQIKQTEQKLQEEIAQITYDYVDPYLEGTEPITDGNDEIILAFAFHLESAARVRFGSTMNFETARDGQDLVHVHVIYNVDNTELNPNNPLIQYYDDGHHILTLDFLTDELQAGDHTFGVAFGVTGGTLS